ncbi:MAG: N-acetylmuramoyl-L-alanine amidase [Muribaculaceae bacterium]|nr:N-acetylmuramoyl-L-alanine amidase [Muribaculaceae bacterium]
MKKQLISLLIAGAGSLGALAGNASDLKVYINPGHGGHDSDDRNVVIEPYASGDPNGYWESNSNLDKGLALRDQLEAKGYTVVMSRVTNTTADDLGLSTIVSLANKSQADIFFSIHSNATGTSARRNFPLMLFRGYDDQPVKPEDKVVAGILNKHLLENEVTHWTSTSLNIRGDWSFYKSWGTSGLGVLRGLTVTGMLSEGSFHDYIPEAYRLMNKDFCWLEAYHFRRAIDEYFQVQGTDKGHIFGRLNDVRFPRAGSYLMYGDDLLATIQTAKVELYDASGKLVDTYTTETVNTNGVYAFKNLTPGTYTIKTNVESHYSDEKTVEVKADEVTYANFKLNKVRNTPPQVLAASPEWKEGDEAVLCNAPVVIDFNWDMDTELTEKAFSIEPAAEGTFTWEDLNYRMIFTPTAPYATNTLYTVTISTDAAHGGGTKMEAPFSLQFKTTDRNFLQILATSPAQDAMVHYTKPTIEIRSDKRPSTSQVLKQIKLYDEQGNAVALDTRNARFDSSKSPFGFVKIPVLKDLEAGKMYRLEISKDFADRDGLTLQNGVEMFFTACDASAHEAGKVIDEMTEPTAFVYNEEQSQGVTSQKVAADSKTALFGKAINYTYAFNENEGGEILWDNTAEEPAKVNRSQKLSVHVNGDLSGNTLYLLFSSPIAQSYVPVTNLDFLGWKHIVVSLEALEGTDEYTFEGVKLVQTASQISGSGTFGLDRIEIAEGAGISSIVTDNTVTISPNPASEYIVANADGIIESVELVDMDGRSIAKAKGNVLNVSSIANGHYIALVTNANGTSAHRVIIVH